MKRLRDTFKGTNLHRLVLFAMIRGSVSFKRFLKDDKSYRRYVKKLIAGDSKPIRPCGVKSKVVESLYKSGGYSMQLFRIGEEAGKAVLYLPGGGYVQKAVFFHWSMADRIARRTRSTVYLASYPTAPVHTYVESFVLIESLYRSLVSQYGAGNISLVGDSAGGGLAAALCQHFAKQGLPQPSNVVLISPWVDATMSNDAIPSIDRVDPMLPSNAFMAAIAWAGEEYSAILDKAPVDSRIWNWQISPVRGDVSVMKRVRIFVGTREVFYPDVLLFDKKLRECGVDVRTYVGPEMYHVFPLYPFPEVQWAVDEIVSILS